MPVCLHPHCDEEIPKGKHACRYHWRQMPKAVKRPLMNARFNNAPMSLRDATAQAIAFFERQEGRL